MHIKSAILPVLILASTSFSMAQDIVHPALGSAVSSRGGLTLTLADRSQNWNVTEKDTYNQNINSPKSINIHPDGTKYYVNSLEGGTTVVFDAHSNEQLAVIKHVFDKKDSHLWAAPSGFYKFKHYSDNLNSFRGRPVESAFSHNGRYLWVPYYRRSFDLNAQDPSAVAIIDTKTDRIVRLMETGILPKMIVVSPDNTRIAVAHWGDNTVGMIDCSSNDPKQWHHLEPLIVDRRLTWNFSLTDPVDRDNGSGNALRGSVFTPDGRYLLVACMGGSGGIAVIDTQNHRYLGKLFGMLPNVRHLITSNGYLYLSINRSGKVQRISLTSLIGHIERLRASKTKTHTVNSGWETASVGAGARTIVSSPKGHFIFVACNYTSSVDVINTKNMQKILSLPVDSYPVGMDISSDGKRLYVTSQGRKDRIPSGNCVDIIDIKY